MCSLVFYKTFFGVELSFFLKVPRLYFGRIARFGCLYFPTPSPLLGPRPWPPICVCRPWHQICIYQPWPPIPIYRPWSPICIYRLWPPPCVYPKFVFAGSARCLSLHIPTLPPQFVFTGPGLRFLRTQAAKMIYSQ